MVCPRAGGGEESCRACGCTRAPVLAERGAELVHVRLDRAPGRAHAGVLARAPQRPATRITPQNAATSSRGRGSASRSRPSRRATRRQPLLHLVERRRWTASSAGVDSII